MISRCEAVLDNGRGAGCEVSVTFYEVATAGCCDLLNGRAKINLRSDESEVLYLLTTIMATLTLATLTMAHYVPPLQWGRGAPRP